MRRSVFFLLVLLAVACGHSTDIGDIAKRYVRANYPDCREVVYCNIDTVTYGDNLEWRISQATRSVESAESQVEYLKRTRLSASMLEKEQKTLEIRKRTLVSLDSLKAVSGDILSQATAYLVCIAYNTPTNLVWVQLDKQGNLLKISKDRAKMLINPGEDVPGYLEVWEAAYGDIKKLMD